MTDHNDNFIKFNGNIDDLKAMHGELPEHMIGPKTEITVTYEAEPEFEVIIAEDHQSATLYRNGKAVQTVSVTSDASGLPEFAFDLKHFRL